MAKLWRTIKDRHIPRPLRKMSRVRLRFILLYPLMVLKSALVRSPNINRHEFSVLSQNGEDGIIRYVFKTLKLAPRSFIEFGFHPQQANALVPLIRYRARGLFIDGNAGLCELAVQTFALLRRDVSVRCTMLRPDNINRVFAEQGFQGDVDLLSLDVDSIDYWLWQALDAISPKLVVIETSAWLGMDRPVTMPLDAAAMARLHSWPTRNVARGASPAALLSLGQRKGYRFLGVDRRGVNMFFLRRDLDAAGLFENSGTEAAEILARRTRLGEAEIDALVTCGLLCAVP